MEKAEIINKMIDDILSGENTDAEAGFNSVLASKLTDALEDRKVELAQSLYGKQNDEISQDDIPEEEIDSEEHTTEVE